jgi:hypothetical protein
MVPLAGFYWRLTVFVLRLIRSLRTTSKNININGAATSLIIASATIIAILFYGPIVYIGATVSTSLPSTLSCLAPGCMRVTWGLLVMRRASRKA